MFAVIRTGAKQYKVALNDIFEVEKLSGEEGDTIELKDVLAIGNGKDVKLGNPLISGTPVKAEIVAQKKGDKVLIFKKRRRHNSRRKNGHRQHLTVLRITSIGDQIAPEREKQVKVKKSAEAKASAKSSAKKTAKPAAKKAAPAKAATSEAKPAAKKASDAKKPASKSTSKKKD